MLTLMKTCDACPEQYDALLNGEQVGYLRLRHGHFYAQVPNCGDGPIVYSTFTKGDGMFDEDERDFHLRHACQAILKHLNSEMLLLPELNYVINGI